MSPRRLVAWDRFYGTNSSAIVVEPYPYQRAPLDGARLVVRNGAARVAVRDLSQRRG